jgi:hypothetical protein
VLLAALTACPTDSSDSPSLDHIKVTSLPHTLKYNYSPDETFKTDGLVVTAFYSNGSQMLVTNYDLAWGDTSHTPLSNGSSFPESFAGSVETVVVTWNGKTDHFSITVINVDHTESVDSLTVTPGQGVVTFPISVTLATTTTGATIYYTTDGSAPSKTHYTDTILPAGSAPSGTVPLTSPCVIRAIALKDNANPSGQLVAHYYLATVKFPDMLPLTVENQLFPLTVTLVPATSGSEIYYTLNGAEPNETESATNFKYSAAFELDVPVTLKFKAFKDGMEPSGTATAAFTQFIVTASTLSALQGRLTAAQAGDDADHPVTLSVAMELSPSNWASLLEAIDGGGKYVTLDLSDSTASSAESGGGLYSNKAFDPDEANITGKGRIVELTLPDAAISIGTHYGSFGSLKKITGSGIITVGGWSLEGGGGILEEISFPNLTTLGQGSLWGAVALKTLYIPSVTFIDTYSLGQTGDQALTITLGATPPKLGSPIFSGSVTTKSVTIKIPSGSQTTYNDGYSDSDTTTNKWWNNFRDKKSGITLTFVPY